MGDDFHQDRSNSTNWRSRGSLQQDGRENKRTDPPRQRDGGSERRYSESERRYSGSEQRAGGPARRFSDKRIDGPKICRYCKEEGHLIKECPTRPSQRFGYAPKVCRYCKEEGHLIKNCPTCPERRFTRNVRTEPPTEKPIPLPIPAEMSWPALTEQDENELELQGSWATGNIRDLLCGEAEPDPEPVQEKEERWLVLN